MSMAFAAGGCGIFDGPPSGDTEPLTLTFDFRSGLQGWEGGVSDYPVGQEANLEFDFGLREFPSETGIAGNGLWITSRNTPDDLFTFVKCRLDRADGVTPGTAYRVAYEILVASNAPSGCAGVGGSPGDSVYLKAGASPTEPQAVLADGEAYYRLNVDKGDQAEGGAAASVVSTIANGVPCDLIPSLETAPSVLLFRAHTHETPVTAGDDGELWLLLGTDSGFEWVTAMYYLRIDVTLTPTAAAP